MNTLMPEPLAARGRAFETAVDAYYRERIRLLVDGIDPVRIEDAGATLGVHP